jgi:hypothetical protein
MTRSGKGRERSDVAWTYSARSKVLGNSDAGNGSNGEGLHLDGWLKRVRTMLD